MTIVSFTESLLENNCMILPFQLELLNKLYKIGPMDRCPFNMSHVVQWEQSFKINSPSLQLQLCPDYKSATCCKYSLIWNNRKYNNQLLSVLNGRYGACRLYLIPTRSTQDNEVELVRTYHSDTPFIGIDMSSEEICVDSEIDNFILVVVSPHPVTRMEGNTPEIVEHNKYIDGGIHTTVHSVDIMSDSVLRFVPHDDAGNIYTKYVECKDELHPDTVKQ